MEVLGYLLTGAAAAAFIKLLESVIMFRMQRKAKKEDKDEEKNSVEEKNASAVKNLQEWQERTEEKIDGLVEANQLIMLDRIKWMGQKYIQEGEVDFDDRRILNRMHQNYHNRLGGNGDLDHLMKDVNDLPLKPH